MVTCRLCSISTAGEVNQTVHPRSPGKADLVAISYQQVTTVEACGHKMAGMWLMQQDGTAHLLLIFLQSAQAT